ncbi:MAG: signal peptide peptidase SppA [Firmicutes bacterium]|nr:signal peptide peptidase SppA [Bacillota bacterium]MCM1401420.1 signal peptide peptidase SppA [Bacteroides sp.]MCM1477310.1 signal peptide peptidase SppA [Bacteroides sp.]
MKKFLYSFLGTIAGIWASVLIGFALLFVTIGVLAVSAGDSKTGVNVKDDSILHIELSGVVVDRETPASLIDQIYGNSTETLNLNEVVDAIAAAKEDKRIKGIYLDCRGASLGLAQAQAIIKALEDFKASSKWVYSYADTYTQGDYYVASVSDSLFINPVGMIDIHGLSSTTFYFKELLDKIGVEMQVVKVGTYKSAVEPFILNEMSDANREQQTVFLTNIWNAMRENMAKSRHITSAALDSIANNSVFAKGTEYYKAQRLIDGVKYSHQMKTMLADKTGKADEPSLVSVSDYLTVAESPLKIKSKNTKNIAVLYALGDITESDPQGIASERLVPVILKLAENDDIDGLVLRVNSGGGSAYASEQIWEAFEQFKSISKKPFYVSMSDVAASGGYYISCGANRIYAEPLTLTGSIGIFGMIPNFQPLMKDKLGVNTYTISTNRGGMPDLFEPMTQEQRDAMQSYVNTGYELFVSRCAKGRKRTVDQIKSIAEGRVWDGQSALKNGLVDKLGGLQDALSDMAAELGADDYCISEYPDIKLKWWEMLLDMDEDMEIKALNADLAAAGFCVTSLRSLRNMSPLQCRTDYIKLH